VLARAFSVVALLAVTHLAAVAAPPPADAARVSRARYLMGTLCTGSAEARDTASAARAIDAALDEIARLERVMSNWRADSELSRLNASAASAPFACSPDLWAVLDSALALAALTDGAFDATVEPLARAWDLRGTGRVPSDEEIVQARMLVGAGHVTRDVAARAVRFDRPGVGFDLGGIGKGYALDRAADTLRALGVRRATLNLGGEVVVLSEPRVARPAPASAAVAHPLERLRPVVELAAEGLAISTSSQNERGFEIHRARYGHILDPHRGSPPFSRASVTVIASSATRADALSTALLVHGREGAGRFAGLHPELGVLWLEASGDRVRAWRWNLAAAWPAQGANVQWMNDTPMPAGGSTPRGAAKE
jgi:thiamine biosynthesis lipoprotein